MRSASGRDDLLARGIRFAVRDVVVNGALEQPCILQHHAKRSAQARARDVARLDAVQLNATGIHVVKSQQQVDQRRLTAACRTDKRKPHTRLGVDADVLKKLAVLHIGEINMGQAHAALGMVDDSRVGRVGLLLDGIEQGKQAACRSIGRLDLRDDARHLVERLGVLVGVRQKRLNLAHRQ